jgi:maltose-binding protein MalE
MIDARSSQLAACSSLYEWWSKHDPLVGQLDVAMESGQVMPTIPQIGLFFSSVGGALQIATQGRPQLKKHSTTPRLS